MSTTVGINLSGLDETFHPLKQTGLDETFHPLKPKGYPMTAINLPNVIDNGASSVIADGEGTDDRSQMLTFARDLSAASLKAEADLSDKAKDMGHRLFRAVYVGGANMDALIGDIRVAASWDLLKGEAGKRTRQRFNTYVKNFRMVAEKWTALEEAVRSDILNGARSVHYQAKLLDEAWREAEKAEKKAAAALAANEKADAQNDAANDANVTATTSDVAPLSLSDMAAALIAAINAADENDLNDAYEAIEGVTAAFNARIDAAAADMAEAA